MTDHIGEMLRASVPPEQRLQEAARLHTLADLLEEGVDLGDAVRRVVHPDDEDEQRLAYARARVLTEMARRGIVPPDGSQCNDASGSDHP